MTIVISLPADVKKFIEDSQTDMLDPSIFGKQCLLRLPPIVSNCPNCLPDSAGSKSSNIYLTGGPQPFVNGQICPVCLGNYSIESDNNTTIYGSLEFKFDNFLPILKLNVRHPQNSIQIRTYSSHITDIKNCLLLETLIDVPNGNYQYKLLGEPIIPSKFTTKFCYSVWERA